MRFPRASGVLLHATSLPGPHGSGDLGPAAYRFVDWLHDAGQSLWQMLPLGGIGPGNSPYMSSSAFAGNVLLIDLAELQQRGWLDTNALAEPPAGADPCRIDFASIAFWSSDLKPEEAERARQGIIERSYPKGSYVCHRGDSLDFWTGVVEGLIKISSIAHCGKAMTFAGIGEGGWFGEGSVLKNEPRQYDLVALRDTRLAMMNRGTFNWLVEHSVGFNRFLD